MEVQNSTDQVKKNKWAERLRGRGRMAFAALGGLLALGTMGVANPLLDRIDSAQTRLKKAQTRTALADDVTKLRKQSSLYQDRLPKTIDQNDWTQYMLSGIRAQHVKVVRMDPKDTVPMGPCKVLTWHIELEGDYQSLGRVLSWMENGPRLVRIDRILMQMANGKLNMLLAARGLASEKPVVSASNGLSLATTKRSMPATRNATTRKAPPATRPARSK